MIDLNVIPVTSSGAFNIFFSIVLAFGAVIFTVAAVVKTISRS